MGKQFVFYDFSRISDYINIRCHLYVVYKFHWYSTYYMHIKQRLCCFSRGWGEASLTVCMTESV